MSGETFQVSAGTEFATYKGRVYAFCCPECKPDFEKDPAAHADNS
jgi:YHS domain-containing protein